MQLFSISNVNKTLSTPNFMKKILLLSFSVIFCNLLFSQNMKVTGRVVDTSGVTPIHQASIMAIHLRTGTKGT